MSNPLLERAAPFQAIVRREASRFGLPIEWLNGVIAQESAFKPRAIRGEPHLGDASRGLMQLILSTARGLGYKGEADGLFDPAVNVALGARFLADLRAKYAGDIRAAVAAYNAGRAVRLNKGQRFCLAWKPTAPRSGRSLDRDCARVFIASADGQFGNQPHVDAVEKFARLFADAAKTDPRFKASAEPSAPPAATPRQPSSVPNVPASPDRRGSSHLGALALLVGVAMAAAVLALWIKGDR